MPHLLLYIRTRLASGGWLAPRSNIWANARCAAPCRGANRPPCFALSVISSLSPHSTSSALQDVRLLCPSRSFHIVIVQDVVHSSPNLTVATSHFRGASRAGSRQPIGVGCVLRGISLWFQAASIKPTSLPTMVWSPGAAGSCTRPCRTPLRLRSSMPMQPRQCCTFPKMVHVHIILACTWSLRSRCCAMVKAARAAERLAASNSSSVHACNQVVSSRSPAASRLIDRRNVVESAAPSSLVVVWLPSVNIVTMSCTTSGSQQEAGLLCRRPRHSMLQRSPVWDPSISTNCRALRDEDALHRPRIGLVERHSALALLAAFVQHRRNQIRP